MDQLLGAPELSDGTAWIGVAPHSVRAVPLDYLKTIVAFANERELPVGRDRVDLEPEPFARLEFDRALLVDGRFVCCGMLPSSPLKR